ncbi:zinc finger RNA-binding protein-like [Tropilaelaps mercedesae]|uniref:Zinc finger RNA-binding protein-like n=1 Tax=Tropilaelaps mercedesae TaxID=418985 RepID=A0A1V9XA20_9ACAR|nr:zinc finger RNA-binding protein-like [Tropilaelaps mercedesae]
MSNSYFGFTTGASQYGNGSGYTAASTAAGYGQPSQQYGQQIAPQPRTPYTGYEQQAYQQAYSQQNQRAYEAAKPQPPQTNYYSQSYGHPTQAEPNSHYAQSLAKPYQPPASSYTALRTVTPASAPAQAPTPKSYSVYSSQTSAYGSSYQAASHANNKPAAQANSNWTAALGGGAALNRKPGIGIKPRPKMPPKPQQLHYCEVCKISCAGPQTYKEHLDGQRHKKKEAAAKTGAQPTEPVAGTSTSSATTSKAGRPASHGTSLRCELCDVTCTGADAYAAHIRGAKHQKVVKLHTKLGKPIPSTDPVILSGTRVAKKEGEEAGEEKKLTLQDIVDQDVQPVGQEYIEELCNNEGKVISFQCKLCDCKFSDPNAKEMHMKGRRHRLQYKKKVNPDLVVDIKPSMRRGMTHRNFREREELDWLGPPMGPDMMSMMWARLRSGPPPMMMMMIPFRRPDTPDDRHILAKHSKIYPPEEELARIQKIVGHTEKALKGVSDKLAGTVEVSQEGKAKEATSSGAADGKDKSKEDTNASDDVPPRQLRGVMRVGYLAKGLLLTGDTEVGLVVLSGDKPTKSLLLRVADLLPEQLEKAASNDKPAPPPSAPEGSESSAVPAEPNKYTVVADPDEAAIFVRTLNHTPQLSVKVTLTSPVMRADDKDAKGDPAEVLSREKCLAALADLRHAKWFQARASSLQSCVMLVRIFRDLCRRLPTWASMEMWPLELLIEKVIASAEMPLHPGDALRRVLEAIAFGILLPGGTPGLYDPCEKAPTDALAQLSAQAREDITASAQHALRLIAFRQIHKVLGMEPLPPPKFKQNSHFNRKRRLDNSSESGEADGKKDKKDQGQDEAKAATGGAAKPTEGSGEPSTAAGSTAPAASAGVATTK